MIIQNKNKRPEAQDKGLKKNMWEQFGFLKPLILMPAFIQTNSS